MARIVHLATHGRCNPQSPLQSYLLLAGGHRLSLLDISQLKLGETDLVVLSACETGMCNSGRVMSSLVRSFAHAGAPSLVATLWQVPDQAIWRLMRAFYEHLGNGRDVFSALAQALRDMIVGPQASRSPSAWAGYVPLGKPVRLAR